MSACSILGLQAALDLKIIKKGDNKSCDICFEVGANCADNIKSDVKFSDTDNILEKHKTVFHGIGKVNHTYSITLTKNAVPKICAARKIPIALKDKVKQKIDLLVSEKILIPVTEPTDWVHPIVIAPKSNGDIRVSRVIPEI